jgi:predicted double-glycine peptidase
MRRDHNCGVDDVALVKQRGFSMLDVKHYVESLGMRGRGTASMRNARAPCCACRH